MRPYNQESNNPKTNAQRNLCGRTHYVDNDTLRFHKSRIVSARAVDDGLLFAIVTSDALDYQNTRRGFRYVIFDIFGEVIGRTNLEDAFRSSEKATAAMWDALNAIDAKAHTLAAADKQRQASLQELEELCATVRGKAERAP